MNKSRLYILWIARLIAALILLQTLYFKFGAAPESVYIFSRLGIEPWGRIGAGVAELITSVLLLIPRTSWLGALTGIATMLGAIGAHLTVLGIEVQDDGGYLFFLALVVLLSCALIMLLTYAQWSALIPLPKRKAIPN